MVMSMNDKYCGNCKHFTNEDVNGYGWCSSLLARTTCGSGICREYEESNNGWTEITPDNEEEVYNLEPERIVIANIVNGLMFYTPLFDMHITISTMAKQGGYYYYVLPELKIE